MAKKITVLLLVVTIALGVFGLTGCDLGGEKTYIGSATDRAKMLAAFEEIAEIDSYTETTHTVIYTDGMRGLESKNVIKFQQKDGGLIAEGYSMLNSEIGSYIYIKDNYKYVRLAFAETGIKFSLNKPLSVSMSESKPIGVLSDELKEIVFDLTVTKTKENTTIYSFNFIENDFKVSDYKIITETSSGRLIEFKTDWYNTTELSNATTCTVTYEYAPVTVILPDNLDSYEVVE